MNDSKINNKSKQVKEIKKEKIGGMALFNGLLIRNKEREVITKIENGHIHIEVDNFSYDKLAKKSLKEHFVSLPFVRGVYNVYKTIISSTPHVIKSAKIILDDLYKDEEDIEITKFTLFTGYIIATSIIFSLYILTPNFLSIFFTDELKNIVQALVQIFVFIFYLLIIAKTKMLKVLFEFHGAEHKVVNAYENLTEENITVENVKKQSRFHKRCGGNFVMYLFISILVLTMLIPSEHLVIKTIIQILVMPIIIGFSYEILMFLDKLHKFLSFLSYPAMIIQLATTREPNDEKIKLAIYSLFGCVKEDNSITISSYLEKYKKNNSSLNINYNMDEMLRVLAFVTNLDKNKIYLEMNNLILNFNQQIRLDLYFDKMYKENFPIQYILGKQPFYKEEYIVNKDVLIPREDSEILVEKAIEYINKEKTKTMIDLCSGSGCLGISIAKNSEIEKVFLTDISTKAMEVARKNIELNQVNSKTFCLISNLLDVYINNGTKNNTNKYDMIISNPPYIATKEIPKLSKEVQNEPILALDGGKTGLDFYIKIINQAKHVLKEDGILIFEIGYDQLKKVSNLITKEKEYELLESVKDLSGNDRVIICRFLRK